MNDEEQQARIVRLEEQVWKAVIEKDSAMLARLFAHDYIEVTLEGRRFNKSEIVQESPKVDEIRDYQISNARVVLVGQDAAILSYHLVLIGTSRGIEILPRDRWAVSIWNQTNEHGWTCCFYQQSPYQPSGDSHPS